MEPECTKLDEFLTLHVRPSETPSALDENTLRKVAFLEGRQQPPTKEWAPLEAKVRTLQNQAQVKFGAIQVSQPERRNLEEAIQLSRDGIRSCYAWILGSTTYFSGRGQLLLIYGKGGRFDSALVMSSAYANEVALNACIEQQINHAKHPVMPREDTIVGIPFEFDAEGPGSNSTRDGQLTGGTPFEVAQSTLGWSLSASSPSNLAVRGGFVLPDGRAIYYDCHGTKCDATSCSIPVAERRELLNWVLAKPTPTATATVLTAQSGAFVTSGDQQYALDPSLGFTAQVMDRLAKRTRQLCSGGPKLSLETFRKFEAEIEKTQPTHRLPMPVRNWLSDTDSLLETANMYLPLPHELDRAPVESVVSAREGVFAYTFKRSFHGFLGVIILDDGSTFTVEDAEPGVQPIARRTDLDSKQRQRLAAVFNNSRFFRFPSHLHNRNVLDGSESELYAASSTRAHRSSNYMHPSPSYRAVAAEFENVVPVKTGTKLKWRNAEGALEAYANRLGTNDARKTIVSQWTQVVAEQYRRYSARSNAQHHEAAHPGKSQ
jgi:hypothetical protein